MIDSFAGRYADGRIECEAEPATIARSVHANGVALLTGVFDPDPLAGLRQTVFDWSLGTEPQVLQYPSGGGFFDRHVHPFLPQKIGLIVGLSQQGADFKTGGTWFEFNGERISIENEHDIGDIALFKYDLPHGITAIDDDEELDWRSPRGRRTMVLPYY